MGGLIIITIITAPTITIITTIIIIIIFVIVLITIIIILITRMWSPGHAVTVMLDRQYQLNAHDIHAVGRSVVFGTRHSLQDLKHDLET